jgi:hypothetical protein
MFVKQSNTTTTMTLTADKKTTNLVKKYFKKNGLTTIPCELNGFGQCTVRFVSVSESDKWNYKEQKYARVINFEITLKKSGQRYSQDRIPAEYSWRESRQSFYKNRKWSAKNQLNKMLRTTKVPLFFDIATIPTQNHGELVGNVTYKYID